MTERIRHLSSLRVAIIAPPWLTIPPVGYGGIEAVLEGLILGLKKMGVTVEVFTIGTTKMRGIKTHSLYKTEQYRHIFKPMFEALPILAAHLEYSLQIIKADGKFDIIHDHNGFLGPEVLGWATHDRTLPPVIHTLHGPPFTDQQMLDQDLPDNRPFWQHLELGDSRAYLVGISNSMMKTAPSALNPRILPTVYNAVDIDNFAFVQDKKDYFFTLARFARDKGQHVAARLCAKLGYPLQMAGTVAGINTPRKLTLEISNPLSPYRNVADFQYYSDQILPLVVNNRNIRFLGNVSGKRKQSLISNAKALLFPIDWEEPFGMAVIEAQACGTPVVAMNRGAMPEIIQHGVNGFLANSEEEFEMYMQRVDEISPVECRRTVQEKFSDEVMAAAYMERYRSVIVDSFLDAI